MVTSWEVLRSSFVEPLHQHIFIMKTQQLFCWDGFKLKCVFFFWFSLSHSCCWYFIHWTPFVFSAEFLPTLRCHLYFFYSRTPYALSWRVHVCMYYFGCIGIVLFLNLIAGSVLVFGIYWFFCQNVATTMEMFVFPIKLDLINCANEAHLNNKLAVVFFLTSWQFYSSEHVCIFFCYTSSVFTSAAYYGMLQAVASFTFTAFSTLFFFCY